MQTKFVPYIFNYGRGQWFPLFNDGFKWFTHEDFVSRFGKQEQKITNVVVQINERRSYKMTTKGGGYALSFKEFILKETLSNFSDRVVSVFKGEDSINYIGMVSFLSIVKEGMKNNGGYEYTTEPIIVGVKNAIAISDAINTAFGSNVCTIVGLIKNTEDKVEEVSKPAKVVLRDASFFFVEEEANKVLTLAHLLTNKCGHANVLITGPSGFGKTTLAYKFASKTGRKFVKVDMSLVSEPSEILGSLSLEDGTTKFNETPFTQAIKEGNVVILLDEINRAYPNVTNPLLGLLDDTHTVTYNGITYNVAKNTIFVVTANIGNQYTGTFKSDAALFNRMNFTCSVGSLPPEEEVKIYKNKTGISDQQASAIVKALLECRASLSDENIDFSPRTGLTIAQVMEFGGTLRFAFMSAFGSVEPQQKKAILDILSKQGEFKNEHKFDYLFT